jgi:dephospho-CoA kinase
MRIAGITGGIASGKSTVAALFAACGAQTRSADEDARAILQPDSPALDAVFAAFPAARSGDGTLDRAALASRIFADAGARRRLEAIMHPAIVARMREAITEARQAGPGLLVYETPLLYEAGLEGLFDIVIAVKATPALQAMRLREREVAAGRPPLTDEAVAARLAAQLSPEEKARRAHYVIATDVSLEETRSRVNDILREIASL